MLINTSQFTTSLKLTYILMKITSYFGGWFSETGFFLECPGTISCKPGDSPASVSEGWE